MIGSTPFAWLGSRRSVGAQFLVLLLAGLVPVLSRGTEWLGSWKMALDWGTFCLTLLGPAAAGVACSAYVRLTTSGVDRVILTGTRPLWSWTRPGVTVWLLGAVATVTICLGVTIAASAAGSVAYPSSYWVVAPALCVLAAQVAVGAAIGGLGRRRWLIPVAVATTFGLGVLTAVGVIANVFRTGGVSGALVGQTFRLDSLALQGGSAIGIAAALAIASNPEVVRLSRPARWTLPAVSVAGLALYVVVGTGDYDRYAVEDEIDYECAGEAPQVCMASETTRPLADLSVRVGRFAEALRAIDVPMPDRFVQIAPGRDIVREDGAIDLSVDQTLAVSVTDDTAVRALTTPALCPQYVADVGPPEALFDVQRLLGRWLLHRAGELKVADDDQDAAWLRSDLEEQAAWIETTYLQLRECRIESVRLPREVG